jgi:hypothetical protein
MSAVTQSDVVVAARTDHDFFSPVRGRNRSKSRKGAPAGRDGIAMGITNGSLTLSAIEFCGWLGQAEPGDVISYHRGFLVLDRVPSKKDLPDVRSAELDLLAKCAMRAAERDLVHLVQRRNASLDFSYLAIARPRPQKVSATVAFPMLEAA